MASSASADVPRNILLLAMSPLSNDRTVDPEFDRDDLDAGSQDDEVAVIEVAFHAELDRIGDELLLPLDERVAIGREAPLLHSASGSRPLLDPCISRRQLTLSYDRQTGVFRASPAEDARRPLVAYDARGQRLGSSETLPSGSFLAIGDRALLILERRPRRGAMRDGSLGLQGDGPAMRALRARIRAVAAGSDPVLVLGETGTGKELVARAVHEASPRARSPFVAVNCAALPDALIESELFGHVRGAFSGAHVASPGVFRAADGGTLFLDEVAELSLTAQAKLLRALETRAVRPVGSTSEQPVDVRVVAATHQDLNAAVRAGTFRSDLFARLDGPSVEVPALRERRSDLPRLFKYFLAERRAIDAAVNALFRPADARPPALPLTAILGLLGHDWPRNVRELSRYVAKVAAAARESSQLIVPPLTAWATEELEPPRSTTPSAPTIAEPARSRPSREELAQLMEAHDYVAHRVARALGVPRTTLDRWLRGLGLLRPADLDRETLVRALQEASGDVERAAVALQISARGLRLRLSELGLT